MVSLAFDKLRLSGENKQSKLTATERSWETCLKTM